MILSESRDSPTIDQTKLTNLTYSLIEGPIIIIIIIIIYEA